MSFSRIAIIFLLPLVLSFLPVSDSGKAFGATKTVTMNFDGADLRSIIRFMSDLTGKNFLIDSKVQGKVTIFSPQQVTVEEAYKVFESILVINGFTIIPTKNGLSKIVPITSGMRNATYGKGEVSGDHYITRLITLRYKNATQLVPIIRPILSQSSYLTAYEPTNTLIISDLSTKVSQVTKMVKSLDVRERRKTEVIPLKYANAKEIQPKIEGIFDMMFVKSAGKKIPKEQFNISSDDRTNSIILVADVSDIKEMREVIEDLDLETPRSRGRIHVYRLKNASADELAKTLAQITPKSGVNKAINGKVEFTGQVTILGDKSTNSLIITASPEDYEVLQGVIKQLDVRQPQIFVEAMIMEISSDRSNEFGVEWRSTSNPNNDGIQPFGGTNFGNITAASQNPFNAAGLLVGVVDGTVSFGGKTFLNIGALVKALQKDTGVDILSTPNILTSNNEDAEIHVGDNIPVNVGATTTTIGVTQNIQRTDIGIVLKITPQISDDDYVKLKIYEEISSLVAGSVTATDITNPITSKRSATTTVVVRDRQMVVIGGLVQDDLTDISQQVPLLGDIPILGHLFKSTTKTKKKKNLVIFLTPHIIRTPDQMDSYSEQKINELKKERQLLDETETERQIKNMFR